MASYLSVPPSTLVNQCRPTCSAFLAVFQKRNSSIEAESLPAPSVNPVVALVSVRRAPMFPISVPVTGATSLAPAPFDGIAVSIQAPFT